MNSIFIPNRGIINVYHFLIYMIANLRYVKFIPTNIYIDLNNEYFEQKHNYVIEILHALYPDTNIINATECPVNCVSVYQELVSFNREDGASSDAYKYLRKIFIPILEQYKPTTNYSEYIYISRMDDTDKRRVLNEKDMLSSDQFIHFQKITASKIPLLEQMYIFYKAKVIISIHGAALVNILFCNVNCKIVEIATHTISRLKHFEHISQVLNLNYCKFTDITEFPNNQNLYNSDLMVNTFDIA